MKASFFAVCAVALLLVAGEASAATLGLVKGYPDINAASVLISFTDSSGVLDITGTPDQLTTDNIPTTYAFNPQVAGNYHIHALLNSSDELISASITIDGAIPTYPSALNGNILAGSASGAANFGFDANNMEFKFDITGGLLQPIFGSKLGVKIGSIGLMYLDADEQAQRWTTVFDRDLSNGLIGPGTAVADDFPVSVPTPSALWGGLVMMAAMAALVANRLRLSAQ